MTTWLPAAPTISNRTGDLIDLFDRHRVGLLAADDPEDIAEKVLLLLADQSLADEMGANARKTAEKFYDWRILAEKLVHCFTEVLEHKPESKEYRFK